MSSHTHRGAMTLFHLHFVKTGIISHQLGGLFRQLYGMRHEGDYEDFIDFSCDMIEPYFPMGEEFIDKVKEYLLLPPMAILLHSNPVYITNILVNFLFCLE